jgi:hypothetical protein
MSFDFTNCDILTIFEGIRFLPLDKDSYLRVQSFAASLENEIFSGSANSGISVSTMFMYMDFLIWSSLDQADTQILYEHVVKKVYPECVKQDLLVKSGISSSLTGKFVGPIYGPTEVKKPSDVRADSLVDEVGSVKTVYLSRADSAEFTGIFIFGYFCRKKYATIVIISRGFRQVIGW